MNILNLLLDTPLNAIFQILLGIIGGVVIFPNARKRIHIIILAAIIMEIVIDGAHLINKNITHNLFFMLQLPLILFFFGYTFNYKRIINVSFLFLANSISHFISDTAFENSVIVPLYPFSSQIYRWNYSLNFLGLHGAPLALFILLMIWVIMRLGEEKLEKGTIGVPSLHPARIGKRVLDKASPPS